MIPTFRRVQSVYLILLLLSTLATSLIWGINTLFLLDAGLTNTEAFLVNAFFTIGQVIFEVPTGMVADTKGRQTSYLLGTLTLAASTFIYLLAWQMHAELWLWAVSSILLGLGFSFFSGATEAWLVDAVKYTGFKGPLETVFAKGQIISGVAMLLGAAGGGVLAQLTNLSVPYIVRSVLLLVTFVVAFIYMKDWGFKPEKSLGLVKNTKQLFVTSWNIGWRNKNIRWIMLSGPFTAGVGFYAFYAMQPYLLELYKDESAYAVAGSAAAIVAGAQIIGGIIAPHLQKIFKDRTSVLMTGVVLNVVLLALLGVVGNFWLAIVLLCIWGLVFSATLPIRQAYLNNYIPSQQRATVLSFDSLVSSSGGVIIQPVLGKVADVWSYSASLVGGAVFQAIALPFVLIAHQHQKKK